LDKTSSFISWRRDIKHRLKLDRWLAPPIPACIVNLIDKSVLSPGLRTVEPTVTLGGQHPSTTSVKGNSLNFKGLSPTFVTWKDTATGLSNLIAPKST
jgi:hypothetical protein